jgi:MoxR-like ATPase
LDLPYFVLATQNPIEQEVILWGPVGSFYVCHQARIPLFAEEVQVVKRTTSDEINTINSLFTAQEMIFSNWFVEFP